MPGDEKPAQRNAAHHNGQPSQRGQWIVHEDEEVYSQTKRDEDDGRPWEPPGFDRFFETEQRGSRKSQEEDHGEDDVGQHAVKAAK